MTKPPVTVDCPICGKSVQWLPENRYRPFCSERCKQIDLGAWANDEYCVPVSDPDGPDRGDAMGTDESR